MVKIKPITWIKKRETTTNAALFLKNPVIFSFKFPSTSQLPIKINCDILIRNFDRGSANTIRANPNKYTIACNCFLFINIRNCPAFYSSFFFAPLIIAKYSLLISNISIAFLISLSSDSDDSILPLR